MILEIKNLVKTFPGVKALHRVNFQLEEGEIHALAGGHGSGKSVLIKVLSGLYPKDSGIINYNGCYFEVSSPREAEAEGLCPVFQEVNLIHNLTVAENLFMDNQLKTLGFINWKKINKHAHEALMQFELDIDVTRELGELSIAAQQMVVIARAIMAKPKVLILDEPTSSLNSEEAEILFGLLRKLKSEGCSIILITHFLDQIYSICDRVTVLKNGENVGTWSLNDLPEEKLTEMVAGDGLEAIGNIYQGNVSQVEEKIVDGYDLAGVGDGTLTFAEVLKSGNIDLSDIKINTTQESNASLTVNKQCVTIKNPFLKIPDNYNLESNVQGEMGELSILENLVLALKVKRAWFGLLPQIEQEKYARIFATIFEISTSDFEQKLNMLNADDQRKISFAREVASDPSILMIDEPSNGIDLCAKKDNQNYIIRLNGSEVSVIFISSELNNMINSSSSIKAFC